MNNLIKNFGKSVRKAREEKGFSQEKLAELTGLHRTYIGGIERGERNASIKSIQKIANALKINISTLFELIEKNELN